MIQKIRAFMEKFSHSHATPKDFKIILFHNFFGNLEDAFKSEEALEFTASFCFETLLQYQDESAYIKSKESANGSVAYCVVMQDKPFITDSVLNFIHNESLLPSVFIHPNFYFNQSTREASFEKKEGGKRYSVVYFELSQSLSETQEATLKDILEEVYIATESYAQMKDAILSFGSANYKGHEIEDFCKWICDEAFVILGVSSKSENLGLCTLDKYSKNKMPEPQWKFGDVVVTKSFIISSIHRSVPLDIILIKNGSSSFKIYGMFTTHSYKSKLLDIPIINTKVHTILKRADFHDVNYNRKELFSFLENLPREELFATSPEFLFESAIGYIHSLMRDKTFVYCRQSVSFPIIKFAVFTPNTKFTFGLFKAVAKILQSRFEAKHITQNIANAQGIERFVMSFIINRQSQTISGEDIQKIVKKIQDACENAEDNLLEALHQIDALHAGNVMKKYQQSLPSGYVSQYPSGEIAQDILLLEKLSDERRIIAKVRSHEGNAVHIKVYSTKQINLQKVVRVLEHCGILVFGEQPFMIRNDNVNVFIHSIDANVDVKTDENLVQNEEFTDVIEQCLSEKIFSTTLNKLSITSSTKVRDIFLLRAYVKYLKQINFQHQEEVIHDALAKNPEMLKELIRLFYVKFDPEFKGDRNAEIEVISKNTGNLYAEILDITQDAVMRQLYKTIQATVRTNFFLGKEYISLKFDCKAVPNLPKPVPFREIFVYSLEFEAVHLRFGKVARGGLRWSDRHADFRTEVLGLVKAQNTKNAVIVPVGSKGGFAVYPPAGLDRSAYQAFGQDCYKRFIAGCLDLCDNIVNSQIVTPQGIVKWEDEDPYFVVAADKGTATFSDLANSVAAQYNFWLGDAFASGGSYGYDHKKMAITAKGAWIAARRHMMELGIDPEKDEFTCIGIGDLSGDVFGNGSLRSQKMKLIAAFNHMHIFVDPNPDLKKSFAERERMYNLPRSIWTDYNKSAMSKGGAVFERSARSCKLTPEIKALLEIKDDEVTPDQLIIAILKVKCDMLWNGGIGTYVKASSEKHSDVGDKANNSIRVNGNELRCKVVAEGGNLGFTQKGRIEYAQNGGCINTDAMDNSAGVNCSDVEVNIKILLNKVIMEGALSLEQRNILLEQMTVQVTDLVLRNNYQQTQAITVTSYNGNSKLENQEVLMKKLEEAVHLDRENEFLPSTARMSEMKQRGESLTRPELCVLFAYSKIYLFQELLNTSLITEKYFESELLAYFPKQMQERFKNEILSHKLAKEIIATSVNNSVVNRVGITFVNTIAENLQCKLCDVVRAYVVMREIFSLNEVWLAVENLDGKVNYKSQVQLFVQINNYLRKCIYMLLGKSFSSPKITDLIMDLLPCVKEVVAYISKNPGKTGVTVMHSAILENGVPSKTALEVANVLEAMSCFAFILQNKPQDIQKHLDIYYSIIGDLSISQIQKWISALPVENRWSKLAVRELEEKLQYKCCTLVLQIASVAGDAGVCASEWKSTKEKQIAMFRKFVDDVSQLQNRDFAVISMLVDKLDIL